MPCTKRRGAHVQLLLTSKLLDPLSSCASMSRYAIFGNGARARSFELETRAGAAAVRISNRHDGVVSAAAVSAMVRLRFWPEVGQTSAPACSGASTNRDQAIPSVHNSGHQKHVTGPCARPCYER